ncbi:MAG: hypothetical protein LBV74_00305 [Tannerella sp.]|jgi:hypothetical protein|nr:hypothetical protein [Tannerella sp.]
MKNLLLISLFLLAAACTSIRKGAHVEQVECAEQVVLWRYSFEQNRIAGIQFPLGFRYSNKSLGKSYASHIAYLYEDEDIRYVDRMFNAGIRTRQKTGDSLVFYDDLHPENIYANRFKSVDFVLLVNYQIRHNADTITSIQSDLHGYLEQMDSAKVHILNIGTLSEVKSRHPELTGLVFGRDTINFSICNTKGEFVGLRFKLPILF